MTKPEHIAYLVALNGVAKRLREAQEAYAQALVDLPPGNGHKGVLTQHGVLLGNMRAKINGFLGEVESGNITPTDPRVQIARDG